MMIDFKNNPSHHYIKTLKLKLKKYKRLTCVRVHMLK